ncbi:MAG: hypothetical protein BGO67_02700 [Alphaproteobacteria bacterium 41-28]|nr:MAG: hypothetical protein BGO67_02700 [Alphaproteobacteria bacterium 41-28]
MLYPNFEELVALKKKTLNSLVCSKRKVVSNIVGDRQSPLRGQGLEFEEVRAYAPGDDIRNIDWRVTARTGAPHTKVFRQERERNIIVCVDVNVAMRFGTKGTFKSIQAARVAALLGWNTIRKNDKLGACLFGDVPDGIQFFKPRRSHKILWTMFKALSNTNLEESAPHISLENMLSHIHKVVPTGTLTYIISDFSCFHSTLGQQLNDLKKRSDVILITIDDPADQHIEPVGPILFVGNSHEKFYANTDIQIERETYAMQWHQTRKTLQQIAEKLDIGIISIATDVDASTELFYGLKGIQKRSAKR